jgi:D-alanyl-D-alanine carboxypeptidase (penicillin-binding protein 5/6)
VAKRDQLDEFGEMLRRADVHDTRRPVEQLVPVDPVARRRRRRRRLIAALVVVVLALGAAGGYAAITLNSTIGAAVATVHRPEVAVPAAAALTLPPVGESAISVAGADDYLGASAGGILASSGGDAPLPIASISKLITAMVVLDHKPLGASGTGPTLTFDKTAHALYDKYYLLNATIAAMPTGSTMTEHDAIETMLVVSACNYAEAVSTWAFGSQPAFLAATKKWLSAHGMSNTRIVEPTGIDAHNVSTPSDMIALGKLAMADPAIAAIVAKTSLDVPSLMGLPNTNALLGTDGINGIKTGTLGEDSELLYSAVVTVGTPQPLTIIGVVLGGDGRSAVDAAVRNLIDSLTAGFHSVALGEDGQVVGTYTTPWGAKARMVLGSSATVFTYSNTPITSTMTTTTVKTGTNGEKVGLVTWTAGKSTATAPVVLQGTIAEPTAWWRLTHPKITFHLDGAG